MTVQHVFLIPGFFGFTQLAGIEVFAQVRRVLARALEERGVSALIVGVKAHPTAALHERARRLAAAIAAEAPAGPLHLVGHFRGPEHASPHDDWLPSGSRFRRDAFVSLWGAAADLLARPAGGAGASR